MNKLAILILSIISFTLYADVNQSSTKYVIEKEREHINKDYGFKIIKFNKYESTDNIENEIGYWISKGWQVIDIETHQYNGSYVELRFYIQKLN